MEHQRRDKHEHNLRLAHVREAVVNVFDVWTEIHHDAVGEESEKQPDGDLGMRPGIYEDEQAREHEASDALEDDKKVAPRLAVANAGAAAMGAADIVVASNDEGGAAQAIRMALALAPPVR